VRRIQALSAVAQGCLRLSLSKTKFEHSGGANRRELVSAECFQRPGQPAVCTENLIRVDEVMESPKLAE
jgi:hypothetical protein